MVNPENPSFSLFQQRFEAHPTYPNIDRAPKTVVTQTDSIIELSAAGIISPGTTDNYLSTYTRPFLKNAAQGVERVYSPDPATISSALSSEVNEAADFTNLVFTWMHYFASSRFLPKGFARRGVLKAPQTRAEFVARILEINDQLFAVEDGKKIWGVSFMSNLQAFRTFAFFRVGSALPLKLERTVKERKENEAYMLEKLLEGIDTNLSS